MNTSVAIILVAIGLGCTVGSFIALCYLCHLLGLVLDEMALARIRFKHNKVEKVYPSPPPDEEDEERVADWLNTSGGKLR